MRRIRVGRSLPPIRSPFTGIRQPPRRFRALTADLSHCDDENDQQVRCARSLVARWWPLAILPAWSIAVIGGMGALFAYASEPGLVRHAPQSWPQSTALEPPERRPALLVFLHPNCPCSRATVRQLERLVADADGRMSVRVLVLDRRLDRRTDLTELPDRGSRGRRTDLKGLTGHTVATVGWSEADLAAATDHVAAHIRWSRAVRWSRTNLTDAVAAIPDVTVIPDPGGAEARRFGGLTSGHVVLYDTRGRLRFAGGLTSSRGHEGISVGHDAILAALDEDRVTTSSAPVFGCPIHNANPCVEETQCREASIQLR